MGGAPDPDVLRDVPRHDSRLQEQVPDGCPRDQPHGRVDAEGCLAILCFRGGAPEGSLPEHALLQVADQPGDYLLQQRDARGAAREEDHRARLLVLLHPRPHVPVAPQPRLPRLPQRRLPLPRVLRLVHSRHRHRVCERCHQFRFPEELGDVLAPDRSVRSVRPPGPGHQPGHLRRPHELVPCGAGAGYGDQADHSEHRPGVVHVNNQWRWKHWAMKMYVGRNSCANSREGRSCLPAVSRCERIHTSARSQLEFSSEARSAPCEIFCASTCETSQAQVQHSNRPNTGRFRSTIHTAKRPSTQHIKILYVHNDASLASRMRTGSAPLLFSSRICLSYFGRMKSPPRGDVHAPKWSESRPYFFGPVVDKVGPFRADLALLFRRCLQAVCCDCAIPACRQGLPLRILFSPCVLIALWPLLLPPCAERSPI